LGGGKDGLQPIGPGRTETANFVVEPGKTVERPKCELNGKGFQAKFSTRGASLVDFNMTGDQRYTEGGKPVALSTVPDHSWNRFALGFDWRALGTTGDNAQVGADVVEWKVEPTTDGSCAFSYADDKVKLTKTFRAGDGPYEIVARATIENTSDTNRVHRLGVENTAWRFHKDTDSHFGRQSPFATEVSCAQDRGKLVRKSISDFAAKDFEKPEFENGWFLQKGAIDFAATTNAYFAQAIVPLEAPAAPICGLQIEERWQQNAFADKTKDPDYGAMYRSRLIYPQKELAPHESATYEVGAYFGPKDRSVLAHAMNGQHHLSEVINLGTFAVVSKVLVMFLIKAHDIIGNWGLAIIALTITVKILMFPLTWKQIQSTLAIRKFKPELDELNRKYKDDPQQKQLATVEFYRKNGISPLKGCLPMVVQTPVWLALYTVLQTAVELYHTPFLWFRDLSAPDPFFILPVVIGGTSFLQQKLMPQQGDPTQQKMMLYFMPALFTVMMLFLPSGLGVYMLTNSVLGIVQQQAVERFAPRTPNIQVRDKDDGGDKSSSGKKDQRRKLSGTLPAKLKGGS
jgi:YidC/Oxa1 family membrane protein insertase